MSVLTSCMFMYYRNAWFLRKPKESSDHLELTMSHCVGVGNRTCVLWCSTCSASFPSTEFIKFIIEMETQQLRAMAALEGDPGLTLSTYMTAHKSV